MINPRLLIATRNQGKLREYQALLAGGPFTMVSLTHVGIQENVKEGGCSFEENASLKARTYGQLSGLLTLADDSGLEVDALCGEPGVMSARYAGSGVSDAGRTQYLLRKLDGVSYWDRTARFRCVIALMWPSRRLELCQGVCNGIIAFEPQGSDGFGYDPVFYLPDLGRTVAQLSLEEKNQVSHRAMAARQALGMLEREMVHPSINGLLKPFDVD